MRLRFAAALALLLAAPAGAQDRILASQRPPTTACPAGGPIQVWLLQQSSSTDCDNTVSGTTDALCCCINGTWGACSSGGGGGSGTVTSVGVAVPAEWSVSGSPVTTSGTITIAEATQGANTVYAGPTSGGAAAPSFRALVEADVPASVVRRPSWDNPPASPSAYDDEFDAGSLDAKWTITSTGTTNPATTGTIDYTASLTTPIIDAASIPGWLALQNDNSTKQSFGIYQTISLATDATFFAKLGGQTRDVSASNEGDFFVKLYDSSDANEWVLFGVTRNTGTGASVLQVNNNGSVVNALSGTEFNNSTTHAANYLAVWKKSDVYYLGVAYDNGVFTYLGSVAKTGATKFDSLGIGYFGSSANETPSIIDGIDFFRYKASLDYSLVNP